MNRKIFRLALITILGVTVSLRADDPVTEWVPQEAQFFVGTSNCDQLIAQFKKTRAYAALEDPALKETMQPWKQLYENAKKVVAERVGLDSTKELELWPHGGLAFYVMAEPGAGEDAEEIEHVCAIAEMGEDGPKAKNLMRKIVDLCQEQGAEKQVAEIGGIEIITIQFPEAEEETEEDFEDFDAQFGEDSPLFEGIDTEDPTFLGMQLMLSDLEAPEKFAYAFADTRIVFGSDEATVKEALLRLRKGGEGSLASLRDMRSFRQRFSGKGDALFAINFPAIGTMIEAEGEEAQEILQALRYDAMGVAAFGVDLVPTEGVDSRVFGFLPLEGNEGGLASLLKMENTETAPRESVPADSAIHVSINLDPTKILDEVVAITRRIDPENADMMQASLKIPQEDGTVLDVRKDVVGQMRGPLAATLTLAPPFDAENVNLSVRLGHKSRDAIAKLYGMLPPGFITVTEILGQTVYELPMVPGVASGYTDRALIPFATRRALESYIRAEGNQGRGLAEAPAFRKLLRHVPRESSVMAYVDGPLLMDVQIAVVEEFQSDDAEMLEQEDFASMLRFGLASDALETDLDVLKAMRKYEEHGLITVTTEPEGIHLEMISMVIEE